jgi:hypothetical protein
MTNMALNLAQNSTYRNVAAYMQVHAYLRKFRRKVQFNAITQRLEMLINAISIKKGA